jgi:hypothetical protein
MKTRFDSYQDKENNSITIECETPFERSVFEGLFREEGALAIRWCSGITIKKLPKELDKLIRKYFEKSQKQDSLHKEKI